MEAVRQLDLLRIFSALQPWRRPAESSECLETPVVLNSPSFSRLLGLFCANAAADANSTAADAASIIRSRMKRPSLHLWSL